MFFDRPDSGERAVLVNIDFFNQAEKTDPREFEELALSAGADPLAWVMAKRKSPDPRFYLGSGKLEELREVVKREEAELVMFNHILAPSQERNLEKELECRVLDRTTLILDIFAQRARTHEGKLQVELAQLQHMSTRLIRGWTHLERQKGGIGLRGPGETQLETDRRLLRERIRSINKRLEKVRKQREQGRRARQRAEIPTVSLVGYTNAGKSTLFNAMADSGVYAADQLFATLDPTMRRLEYPGLGPLVIADTVGFISHLPHKLVEAFRATLEEAAMADLLLVVIDASQEEFQQIRDEVYKVLKEIGAGDLPRIEVFNKIDCLKNASGKMEPRIERNGEGIAQKVWLSAKNADGLELLQQAITERLSEGSIEAEISVKPTEAQLRAALYELGAVQDEKYDEQGNSLLKISLKRSDLGSLAANLPQAQSLQSLLELHASQADEF